MTARNPPDLDRLFAALADPTRRALLSALLSGPRGVGDLAALHPMSLAAVSKHLQILARAGLLSQERAGRGTICRLEPDALRCAFVWMQGFGAYDCDDYDALERLVAAALDPPSDHGPQAGPGDPPGAREID